MILSALILQGGQLSSFLQLVKVALLISVIFPFLFEDTPSILGSLSVLSKIFFLTLIFVSFAIKSLLSRLKNPFSKLKMSF